MIIHTDNFRFLKEVLEDSEYKYLFRDLVVVDIGCNIGAFSLWISDLADKIYGVDIALENVDNFKKTIKDSNLNNIEVFHCGISDYNGPCRIETGNQPASDGGWRIGDASGTDADVFTLKTFMDTHGVAYADVVKLDVEGDEIKIVNDPTFPSERIATVLGEIHYSDPNILDNFKNRFVQMGYHFDWRPNNHFIARK